MPKGLAAFVFSDITAVTEEAELYKKGRLLAGCACTGRGFPGPRPERPQEPPHCAGAVALGQMQAVKCLELLTVRDFCCLIAWILFLRFL